MQLAYTAPSSSIHLNFSASSSIIELATTLRNEGLGLVAYYYFDFRDAAKQDVRGLVSSLVIQLCAKSDLCCDILSDLYFKHNLGLRLPDDDSLTQCLKDMLKLSGLPPIYLIVDALDECPNSPGAPSPREQVLDLIEDLFESHLKTLRFCIASRPEVDIQEALGPLASYIISLHDEAGQQQDIMNYIVASVQSDRKMRKWRVGDRQLVVDTLSRQADGMSVVSNLICQLFYNPKTGFDGCFANLNGYVTVFPPTFGVLSRNCLNPWTKPTSASYWRLGVRNENMPTAFYNAS